MLLFPSATEYALHLGFYIHNGWDRCIGGSVRFWREEKLGGLVWVLVAVYWGQVGITQIINKTNGTKFKSIQQI